MEAGSEDSDSRCAREALYFDSVLHNLLEVLNYRKREPMQNGAEAINDNKKVKRLTEDGMKFASLDRS